ncbi:hypothetical protein SLEP1_g27745 [Rubroshorea leprosula]|uniref:Copia protein n=1 Tax=Rubroshorea leprosula TaxID=152421 RepID=A0AAV5JWZ0_9ROSI|nr:hypothetical protein SLEP1_g27745 [Rubroshorea leprosula]
MTGDKSQFLNLKAMEGGTVTFGDNAKGHIKGIGKVVLFVDKRKGNVYIVDFDDLSSYNVKCLMAKNESESWLWHRRLGHASMHLISKLSKKDLVIGLPKLVFEKDKICDACQQGKQTKISFKSKKDVTTSRPLELLHLDLFGPIDVTSLGEESMHVTFAENNVSPRKVVLDDDAGEIQTRFGELHLEENSGKGEGSQKHNDVPCQDFPKTWKFKKDHPKEQIIGDIENGLMQGEFKMSMMGELNFFLGLQIKQSNEGIFINQTMYTKELLKKFGMEKAKPQPTPMSSTLKLDKDEQGKPFDQKLFRSMIGSLLYLTASRPNIMFSVCLCARFQSCPKESHFTALKIIFKYLIGTQNLGLWYPKGMNFDLIGFLDADFAGSKIDRKSTSGTCQILGGALVSWFSKKQNSIALSTTEAKYIAAGSCATQLLWMKQQLEDFGCKHESIPIRCDNTSTINLTKNPIQHSRTKHIEIRYHFIREHVNNGDLTLEFVKTENQLADIFTKPLNEE